MTFIDVMIRISLSRILSDTLGLPSLFPPHVEVTLPTWLNGVSMKKTKFGWDRDSKGKGGTRQTGVIQVRCYFI